MSYLLDLNEFVKAAWIVQDEYEPPFGHAELLSLKVFTKKMEIDLDKAVNELEAQGIIIENPEQTLEEIARDNETSPMNIYLQIKKFEPRPEPLSDQSYTPESVEFSGTGIGNRSLVAMCERAGVDTSQALARLQAAGINTVGTKTLKVIAEENHLDAMDVLKIILIEQYRP